MTHLGSAAYRASARERTGTCELCGCAVAARELTYSPHGEIHCRRCAAGAGVERANAVLWGESGTRQQARALLLVLVAPVSLLAWALMVSFWPAPALGVACGAACLVRALRR